MQAVSDQSAREYPCDDVSVHEARLWVREFYGKDSYLPELAAAELTSNAIRHASARGNGRFMIVCHAPDINGWVSIDVYDCSLQLPTFDAPMDLLAESGRGLAMLRGLGMGLGARPAVKGWGKVVCVWLNVRQEPA